MFAVMGALHRMVLCHAGSLVPTGDLPGMSLQSPGGHLCSLGDRPELNEGLRGKHVNALHRLSLTSSEMGANLVEECLCPEEFQQPLCQLSVLRGPVQQSYSAVLGAAFIFHLITEERMALLLPGHARKPR